MYKAVVADDERFIREGIFKLINSIDVGVEAVACLKDGREVIDYIQKNEVDIVITDIRMTDVSGLDVAKYIRENNFTRIKVVIISGFKEFEYARQAIAYNVEDYIIKPTNPAELKKLIIKIKETLDTEYTNQKELLLYNELIPILKEEFFNDIIVGGLSDQAEIERRASLLKLNPSLLRMPCVIFEISLKNEEDIRKWAYGEDGFQNLMSNLFTKADKEIEIYKIGSKSHSMNFCAISENSTNFDIFIEKIVDMANSATGFEWTSETTGVYNSLKETEIFDLSEKIKILYSHIAGKQKEEAISILTSLMNACQTLEAKKECLINVFKTLPEKLRENAEVSVEIDFNHISAINNEREIGGYCERQISDIISRLNDAGKQNQIMLIAKKYIDENYAKDISLADVAAKTYLSPVYLSKFFKKFTGENFSDYLVRVRMERAVYLLRQNRKIEDICALTGYNSSRYFHRIFKSYYKMSPKEYARNNFYE